MTKQEIEIYNQAIEDVKAIIDPKADGLTIYKCSKILKKLDSIKLPPRRRGRGDK